MSPVVSSKASVTDCTMQLIVKESLHFHRYVKYILLLHSLKFICLVLWTLSFPSIHTYTEKRLIMDKDKTQPNMLLIGQQVNQVKDYHNKNKKPIVNLSGSEPTE